ncbi:MAG: redoxin domain-containing protein [Thermoleophilaceae bacterium]
MSRASYFAVRPPAGAELPAPELPPRMEWLNVAMLRMDQLVRRSCVLVEFFDTARINSLRTLDYVRAWHERYGDRGLRVIGVHSPAYSFGRERAVVERAVERLGIEYAVLLDPAFEVWRLYGNQGWPARYLFARGGLLRHMHYGEGEYADSERAIQETLLELDPGLELPQPLAPLRAEDADGALLEPQTPEVALPADRERLELAGDWTDGGDYIEAAAAGASAAVEFTAGGAWAVLSGTVEPGLHETGGTVTAAQGGPRLPDFPPAPLAPPTL